MAEVDENYERKMAEDEQNALMLQYMNEVFADAYANIQRGQARVTAAKEAMKNRHTEVQRAEEGLYSGERRKEDQGQRFLVKKKNEKNRGDSRAQGDDAANETSIKEQINQYIEHLNEMDVVASVSVPENLKKKDEAAKWAIEKLRATGYAVDRKGYGKILFSPKDIDKGLRYADTPAEKAAIIVLPQVLKRGIEVGEHGQHKGRNKQTITFAAPVELNGVRGNVAVVVNKHGSNYYAHRIVTPEGKMFVFSSNERDATRELSQGVTFSGSLAETTSVASADSIKETGRKVKQNFSVEEDAAELDDAYAMAVGRERRALDERVRNTNELSEEEKEEEQNTLLMKYMEEIFADVYAEIRRGQARVTAAKEAMKNRRTEVQRAERNLKGAENKNAPPKQRFSIEDVIEGEKGTYQNCVLLNTDIFNHVNPRNWGKVLGEFVYKNLAGQKLTMFDADGNAETVEVAKTNDRVQKVGAKHSHKVIDELARYKGDNMKALATVHLSELLLASTDESRSEERSHQWMDENGWIYRHVYVVNRDGVIYDALLNIADGRNRRIIYTVNNIRAIDKRKGTAHGVVPSTDNRRGSHIKSSSSIGKIPQNESNVKQNFSIEEDAEYMEAVETGDMETAQRMVDEAAERAGYTIRAYHGTPNGTFNEFKGWQYFTESKEYADIYQNQGASSNGYKNTAQNPKIYDVFLKTTAPFDTRNKAEKNIFEKQFFRRWGNGAPLSERGLPDWTDGDDLIEFFDEEGYDYTAILLDEGGTGGYEMDVQDRGISYVVKNPEQIKSAEPVTYDDDGKVIPLSERFKEDKSDIRFSLEEDVAELDDAYAMAVDHEQ